MGTGPVYQNAPSVLLACAESRTASCENWRDKGDRMVRLTRASLLLAVLCLGAAACSNDSTPTTPTSTSTIITNTFSGTLTPNGAASHPFTTTGSGTVTATLTSLGADSPAQVGLSLGTWNGSCQIVVANDKAAVGTVVTGAASGVGQLCVRIYDVGNLVGPLTYDLQVVHP